MEQEKIRAKEIETERRAVRGVELHALLEQKERAKVEARQRDFALDKIQVANAIREAEEVKRKEEEKKMKLRQMQSQYVEVSKKEKLVKE